MGEVVGVNVPFVNLLLNNGILPVIAPIGVDGAWQTYNVNADIAAASIAASLKAEKLVYLSDVEGVLVNESLVHSIYREDARQLIESGVITDGMIPKIRSAFEALDAGVQKVHLIDGRVKHSLLLEIFTNEGVGTELVRSPLHKVMEAAP